MSNTTEERAAKIAAIREAGKAKLAAKNEQPETLAEAFAEDASPVDVETFIAENGLEGNK